jgi:hypothetical protein
VDGRGLLEWSIAATPLPGESVTGDAAVVVEADGLALVGAVDGLGHGEPAARAAGAAAEAMRRFDGEPLSAVVERCHEALKGTRGAAVSVAAVSARNASMTWLGVGNVEGRLVRAGGGAVASLLLRPGVAGYELPPLAEEAVDVRLGDTIVLATDGVAADFADAAKLASSTRDIADRLLAERATSTDDALVVVARFLGRTS